MAWASALLEDCARCRGTRDLACVATLDHLALELDDLVRGGLLRQAMRDVFPDEDLVAISDPFEFRVRDIDANDRNRVVEAKARVFVVFILRSLAARMALDRRRRFFSRLFLGRPAPHSSTAESARLSSTPSIGGAENAA